MKRLTERNKGGRAMAACCGKACEYNYCCETGGFSECKGMYDIIDRLAEIEDILGDEYEFEFLRELFNIFNPSKDISVKKQCIQYVLERLDETGEIRKKFCENGKSNVGPAVCPSLRMHQCYVEAYHCIGCDEFESCKFD